MAAELTTTIALLRRAYPSGASGVEYRCILAALSPFMSQRQLGCAIETWIGTPAVVVVNDSARVGECPPATNDLVAAIVRLSRAGFVEWVDEECLNDRS